MYKKRRSNLPDKILLSKAHSVVGVEVRVCVCGWASLHCFCLYPFGIDLRCVSPVWLGAIWTTLEGGLSAEFPPQAKLVITFPGCHHFLAIHHHLELFGYMEPSDGDRHC